MIIWYFVKYYDVFEDNYVFKDVYFYFKEFLIILFFVVLGILINEFYFFWLIREGFEEKFVWVQDIYGNIGFIRLKIQNGEWGRIRKGNQKNEIRK